MNEDVALGLLWVFWLLVWGVPAAIIAGDRGRPWPGALLWGVLLGPVTVVYLLTRPRTFEAEVRRQQAQGRGRCGRCASFVYRDAFVCPHCGEDLADQRVMLDVGELASFGGRG